MRRPGRIAIATSAVMIVLGLPFLSALFTTVDATVLPQSEQARQVDNILQQRFTPNLTANAESSAATQATSTKAGTPSPLSSPQE